MQENNISENDIEITKDEQGDEVVALKEKLERAEGDLLRALADRENTVKRIEREKSEAIKFAVANFVKDLLGVADIFDQALSHIPEHDAGTPVATFIDGIHLTAKEMQTALEKHGVRKITPNGEAFDHNLHQVILEEPSETVASGHIVRVIQSGYQMHERLLRPALVTVAKG